MRIVQKYGGTSLADADCIRAAARRAAGLHRQGNQVIVVVSAQGHTTDQLMKKAYELNSRPSRREMDALLTTGEQHSAALFAMALGELGIGAVSLTGSQAGIYTDGVYGNARIRRVDTHRLETELAAGKVVVVTGFQGVGEGGDVTTLGRGGSDTTAVALAVWLKADKCQIFTDVDGVYDRDPRRHGDARRFGTIGYDRMLELIEHGAQVLHRPCVELARDHRMVVEVLSAFTGLPGTLVGDLE